MYTTVNIIYNKQFFSCSYQIIIFYCLRYLYNISISFNIICIPTLCKYCSCEGVCNRLWLNMIILSYWINNKSFYFYFNFKFIFIAKNLYISNINYKYLYNIVYLTLYYFRANIVSLEDIVLTRRVFNVLFYIINISVLNHCATHLYYTCYIILYMLCRRHILQSLCRYDTE